MSKILIADDERAICDAFSRLFEMEGHEALIASSGKEALQVIREQHPDAVFMDVRMPGMDGIETLAQIRDEIGGLPVVIMTAYGAMETAMEAVRLDAFDYLGKPVELTRVRQLLHQMLELSASEPPTPEAETEQPEPETEPRLVGQSAPMQELFKLMGLLTTNNMTVLITGESGVGKELVARGIHRHSRQSEAPFVAINCAAIPENLLESELFGHEKGAFTSADARRIGRFESAAEGTLFLDEIGELPLHLQGKLLRVLQERSFERIGSSTPIPLRARLITATNRNLAQEVTDKHFREDLLHRLNLVTLQVPPLRDRQEDIELLARHFLKQVAGELSKPLSDFEPGVIERLCAHAWPGNVRELEHVIKRSALLARGNKLTNHDLALENEPPKITTQETGSTSDDAFGQLSDALRYALRQLAAQHNLTEKTEGSFHTLIGFAEGELIDEALRLCDDNQVSAAKLLGLHRTTLRNKIPSRNN
ncbi:sigma-54-dependent transcriptional regulator [endosymbiont of Lamellibrachia barhami]|uniref:sigma-54-dependent transcriptional regulator n=1 Tax=endosymbiont of Lamellibrachia barhami TaxID=205975 RepID=UPI0015AE7430|nr:sigma-54 dependent transcriptional regulator [endosymbiont of Lamellibrachia barhami]